MADGITRIAVEGFKSISKPQSIEIAPLTILAGANSSGKSSIMQPLLMLKQTLESTFDPGPLLINGGHVKFTSSEQFLSKDNRAKGVKRLSLEIAVNTNREFRITFAKDSEDSKSSLEVGEETIVIDGTTWTLRPDMASDELRQVIEGVFRFGKSPDLAYSVVRNRFFLFVRTEEGVQSMLMEWIGPIVAGVIHVPGLRGNRERTYPAAALGPDFPSTFEYYVASVIEDWQAKGSPLADALNRDLRHLNLAESVVAQRLTEVEIDLQVSRLRGGSNDTVSIADVGLGVVHTLPVLVALRVANEGRLVYIEQPEIHLHPSAHVKLADILAEAAKRGVRVVAETHSSLLLRAIQTLIAKGDVNPDSVRLHWFSRDNAGVTQVRSVTPDENGAFGDWPEDFGDVNLRSEQDYLDAVEDKLAR